MSSYNTANTFGSTNRTRKYRPQHWLIELIEDGNRKRTVLLEGNKRNITFYIRNNTEYLMPFYREMWKMAVSRVGEIQMSGKMMDFFENVEEITPELIDELLTKYENEELIDMFNVKYKPEYPKTVTEVRLSRLPTSWNTRSRKRRVENQSTYQEPKLEYKES